MVYGDFKDLPRRTASDKLLRDNAFNIAKNPKYDGYERELASMVYIFFDKKFSGGAIKSKVILNRKLVEELHKTFTKKLKVYSSFKDNIWRADLADIQLINDYNRGFRFL